MTKSPYSPTDQMPTRKPRWPPWVIATACCAVGAVLGLVIAGVVIYTSRPSDSTVVATASTAPATAGARPRVADLMERSHCNGAVIGTQLYSYETARCDLAGVEVTIAVFDTDVLRDQWVDFAKQFGGNHVVGARWAAGVGTPDGAKGLAAALDGRVV